MWTLTYNKNYGWPGFAVSLIIFPIEGVKLEEKQLAAEKALERMREIDPDEIVGDFKLSWSWSEPQLSGLSRKEALTELQELSQKTKEEQ